jgi:hypothetical protein
MSDNPTDATVTAEEKVRQHIISEIEKALVFKPKKFNSTVDPKTGAKKWHKPRKGTSIYTIYNIAIESPNERNPNYEKIFLEDHDVYFAVKYAVMCVRERWPELEEKLLKLTLEGEDSILRRVSSYLSGIVVKDWTEFEEVMFKIVKEATLDAHKKDIDFTQCVYLGSNEEKTYKYKNDKLEFLYDVLILIAQPYCANNPKLDDWFLNCCKEYLTGRIMLDTHVLKTYKSSEIRLKFNSNAIDASFSFLQLNFKKDCIEDSIQSIEQILKIYISSICKPWIEFTYFGNAIDGFESNQFLKTFRPWWWNQLSNILRVVDFCSKEYDQGFKSRIVEHIQKEELLASAGLLSLSAEFEVKLCVYKEEESVADMLSMIREKRTYELECINQQNQNTYSYSWGNSRDDVFGVAHDDWECMFYSKELIDSICKYVSKVKKNRLICFEQGILNLSNVKFGEAYAQALRDAKRNGGDFKNVND